MVGILLKVALHVAHISATLHRSQFKVAGQETGTQATPSVRLKVNAVLQDAQTSTSSQRMQLVGEQLTQAELVKLQV